MGSQVDTLGDNQNAVRNISNYHMTLLLLGE